MTILITGAGGTLGKAFIKLLKDDHDIIALDDSEWAIAELSEVKTQLKDFSKWRYNQDPCDLIIHCAAYKHINLGEDNIHSFIENNVTKTGRLFSEAYKHNVDILFISTDKAVEPISTYGFTKALGEKLCYEYGGKVARLGNILSSSGSVIPVWEQAIENGEPLPVTDPHMTRYLISADKAVAEVWKGYQTSDRLIIPDMGEPVKLMDLVEQVFDKHNVSDRRTRVIGIRAGEKLNEKLRWDYE